MFIFLKQNIRGWDKKKKSNKISRLDWHFSNTLHISSNHEEMCVFGVGEIWKCS